MATVVAINVAGIWSIAAARRGLREEAQRIVKLETDARARGIESRLAQMRGDLAFMAGSPVFFELEEALQSRDPSVMRFRRLEAEGALLLFLRGHPEVMRAMVKSSAGRPLIEAARRGGVPVLWMSAGETPPEPRRRSADPIAQPIEGRFEARLGTRTVQGSVIVEATVDAARFLARDPLVEGAAGPSCSLLDQNGRLLGSERQEGTSSERGAGKAGPADAEAAVASEGWSAPGPWTLSCRNLGASALRLLEPLAARYRVTLVLNLLVMSLALVLGAFAVHQARVRHTMEAKVREETRVRELERQLLHAERLGTVGRLAAGIAHEINNPLEGMSNYLALAREDLLQDKPGDAARRLDSLQEGVRRMTAIVGQVLAHADPATAPLSPVDVAASLAQTAHFVASRPEFAGIRVVDELPAGLPKVAGRPALLCQVFLNLMLNACEAQPKGGEIRLAARRDKDRVVIEIADRGPGVPPQDAARIFEPFYTTKQSSGLGLSICHAIVTQHGGTLRLEERPGGGALFRIDLPAAAEPGGAMLRPVEGARA